MPYTTARLSNKETFSAHRKITTKTTNKTQWNLRNNKKEDPLLGDKISLIVLEIEELVIKIQTEGIVSFVCLQID